MSQYHLKRVAKGERVTADWANSIVDVVSQVRDAVARVERALYERVEALVELTSDLSMGGSANAKVLWRDGDPNTWKDGATHEITIYDAVGKLEAVAGDRFIARYMKQPGIWVALGNASGQTPTSSSASSSVSEWPNVIAFQLDDTLEETDTSTTVTRTHFWSGNSDNPVQLSGVITLINPLIGGFGFAGEEDAGGIAIYSGRPGFYIIFNMECP